MPEDRAAPAVLDSPPLALPRLSQPAVRALNAAGIRDLRQAAAARRSDLARLHGMGPKALAALDDALRAAGLAFSGEDWPA
ncbi:MAG TPA: hypothetical protein VHN99_08600 [Deinococcales bacterium]|nr:hypothetical protein [Deinococcales bacterium]